MCERENERGWREEGIEIESEGGREGESERELIILNDLF